MQIYWRKSCRIKKIFTASRCVSVRSWCFYSHDDDYVLDHEYYLFFLLPIIILWKTVHGTFNGGSCPFQFPKSNAIAKEMELLKHNGWVFSFFFGCHCAWILYQEQNFHQGQSRISSASRQVLIAKVPLSSGWCFSNRISSSSKLLSSTQSQIILSGIAVKHHLCLI